MLRKFVLSLVILLTALDSYGFDNKPYIEEFKPKITLTSDSVANYEYPIVEDKNNVKADNGDEELDMSFGNKINAIFGPIVSSAMFYVVIGLIIFFLWFIWQIIVFFAYILN